MLHAFYSEGCCRPYSVGLALGPNSTGCHWRLTKLRCSLHCHSFILSRAAAPPSHSYVQLQLLCLLLGERESRSRFTRVPAASSPFGQFWLWSWWRESVAWEFAALNHIKTTHPTKTRLMQPFIVLLIFLFRLKIIWFKNSSPKVHISLNIVFGFLINVWHLGLNVSDCSLIMKYFQ